MQVLTHACMLTSQMPPAKLIMHAHKPNATSQADHACMLTSQMTPAKLIMHAQNQMPPAKLIMHVCSQTKYHQPS
jgi:hypothetical protein